MDPRNQNIQTGDTINGFLVKNIENIESLKIIYYELEHEAIGSRMVHLSSEDDNNVFMVTLATHPEDSTGVAHILEHGVLEGSKNYPVKIFKNLSGRSLNTFLNAMTSADYTAYPFSSRNRADYFNMMDLYMDAVFFPLLSKQTFLQEGWRYEFSTKDDPTTPLEYKGVVFNEMKGAMSNPVRLFHENFKKALFPDGTYATASGGDPKHIPELTFEQWKEFHMKFYHPSNAFFFTHGNLPLAELTKKISDKVLSKFKRAPLTKQIPRQPSFKEPRKARFTFPISKSEDFKNKAFVATIWKLIPITDFYENMKLSVLDTILAGSTSSILNRTLMESGLGSGLAPTGFDTSYSESYFGAGLKDVDEANADKIEKLIITTLEQVCEQGFSQDEVDAAIHEMEFSSREIKGDHGLPFGLSLAFRGLKLLLEGGDFIQGLKINTILKNLRKDALKPDFFKNLIQKYLLNNPHRVTMILAPDPGGMEQQEIDRRQILDTVQAKLTPEQKQELITQAENLLRHQQTEGDTSCLPHISLEDISSYPDKIAQTKTEISGVPLHKHPIPTNGISYLSMDFSKSFMTELPIEGMRYLNILSELGAGNKNYVEMGRTIKQRTGGISVGASVTRNIQSGEYYYDATISSSCLPRNQEAMVDLIEKIISSPDLSNTNRISEILNLRKSYAVPMAAQNGHMMAYLASSRWFCPIQWANHTMFGMEGIRQLLKLTPESIDSSALALSNLLTNLCTKENLNISLTGDSALNDQLQNLTSQLISSFADKPAATDKMASFVSNDSPEAEAWVLSTDVSYVVKTMSAVYSTHSDSPALKVLASLMELPMYELIRAQGGAYGAFAKYNAASGLFIQMTYRDPHTAQSLDAFEKVINKIAKGEFTDEKLHHAIINVISRMDVPPSPREKGVIEFERALTGVTYEHRRKIREGIINTNRDDIIRVVETYLTNPKKSSVAMVISDKTLGNDETKSLNLKRMSLENQ